MPLAFSMRSTTPWEGPLHKRKTTDVFEIREYYTIADLVAFTRNTISRQTMNRWLERAGVNFELKGTAKYIPMDELRLKMPTLWDSLASAKVVRKDYGDDEEA